jgi:hypothetical protein
MHRIIHMLQILLFLFPAHQVQAQSIPFACFDKQQDYSYMWWMKTIKAGNKIFAIKTSHYALSFDYSNLNLSNLLINKTPASGDSVWKESNKESFPEAHPCQIKFGIESDAGLDWCGPTDRNIDNCQLVESGRYFQRRFMTHLTSLSGFDVFNSGLEISSWPDRFTLIFRATPEVDLQNKGLEMQFTFPEEYSVLLEEGDVKALKNPSDGSGFIVIKSAKSTNISLSGSSVIVQLDKASSCPKGIELNAGMIVYAIADNLDSRLEKIIAQENQPVSLSAQQIEPVIKTLDVVYERDYGWHKVILRNDGNTAGYSESSNDRIERVTMAFDNPSSLDKVVRLNFAKGRLTENGSTVFGITGLSAVLRDRDGNPVGIPVQLSKNWHTKGFDGVDTHYYRGPWYHGLSMLTIPANTKVSLEYTSVNALWGSVPAASHAQLSLVGWGSNQLWEESAIGSWGESITYEPDLDQAGAPLLDFRPLMIRNAEGKEWGWTGNMGGADFFNYTKIYGTRSWHSRMRTQYRRYCPNFTEVSYGGTMDDHSMDFEYTASLGRSDDMVRGIYHIRLKVLNNTTFKDFVFFQVAAPSYHYTKSNTLAWGNESGLKEEWTATIGGGSGYITSKQEAQGEVPWFSFTNSEFAGTQDQFRPANRGFVIRSWKARINGEDNVSPWFAEYNATGGHGQSSGLINITPPAGTSSFLAGDFVDAVIELFQIPKQAGDYYGPNQNLKSAFSDHANTHEMVYREAVGNQLSCEVISGGRLVRNYPSLIESESHTVEFQITGGRGYVPLTISRVENYRNPRLYRKVNGSWQKVDQGVHGKDYWQTDYHVNTGTWDITFNVNLDTPGDFLQSVDFMFGSEGSTVHTEQSPEKKPAVEIYPNPSDGGNFRLKLTDIHKPSETRLSIHDIQGRLIHELFHPAVNSFQVETKLTKGIYLVNVKNGDFSSVQKLIVH